MYTNYFKIAFRNLSKQKLLTSINTSGLSIGIACFSIVLLYAFNEFNYDSFHTNAENIYRVYGWSRNTGQGEIHLPMPLGPAMKYDITGVKNFVRIKEGRDVSFVKIEDEI